MILEIISYIIALLYGIAIGSFLNVCIYRIPLGEEIVKTSSHCMTCGYKLKWYDNIPIFSYVLLKGCCRQCHTKLSPQYPLVEATNGLLYVLIILAKGVHLMSIVYCLLGSVLIVISMISARTGQIPIGLLVCTFVLGVAATVIDYQNLWLHLIGGVAVSVFLLLIHWISNGNGVTIGDVLLMASCGLLLGWQLVIPAFFLGCAIGALTYTVCRQKITGKPIVALAPYLSIGVMLMALWGYTFLGWYVKFLMK